METPNTKGWHLLPLLSLSALIFSCYSTPSSWYDKLFQFFIARYTRVNSRLARVVQRMESAIHRINHYPADSVVCFVNTYPLDSDIQPLNNRGLIFSPDLWQSAQSDWLHFKCLSEGWNIFVRTRFIMIDFSGTCGVTLGVKVQSIINKLECSMRFHLLFKMLSLLTLQNYRSKVSSNLSDESNQLTCGKDIVFT